MASLNISKMVLDKDSWENIPPMVFKSFQTTNTNMNAIKKWADFHETRAKSQGDFLTKMEEKLTSVEQNVSNLQQELHSTRVQHEDVETAVQRKGEDSENLCESAGELEMQQRTTDQNMERLGSRIQDHMTEMQRLVSDMGRQTDDKVEDYRNQVAKMVEGHMNALNAYLNTMHVKTDVIRVDLDQLGDQAPKLAKSIEELGKKLEDLEQAHETKAVELHESMDDVRTNMADNVERHDGQHGKLSKAMQDCRWR
eukprot:Skav223229  [mRNA]  locus=scaffold2231:209640:216303:+ [translate_table: standard]